MLSPIEGCRSTSPPTLTLSNPALRLPRNQNPQGHINITLIGPTHQRLVAPKKKKPLTSTIQQMERADREREKKQDETPVSELMHGIASSHLNPRYSDLTIVCGSDEYPVHKCIVCPRSAFLAKACDSGFQESFTNRIILQEEPVLVKGMIEYLYRLDYEVPPSCPGTDVFISLDKSTSATVSTETLSEPPEATVTTYDPLLVHILMYSLADRMFIEGLKLVSQGKVEQELDWRVNSEIFPRAIIQIYKSTPESDRGLRDIAIRATMNNLKELRTTTVAHGGEMAHPVFPDSLVKSTPQFASDLAVAMMEKTVSDWGCYGSCMTNWRSQYGQRRKRSGR